jgi:hypothetical protein
MPSSRSREVQSPLDVDWVARGIATAGIVIALFSVGWNIFTWRRQGPVLKLKAKCSGRGNDMTIAGRVSNIGRLDAQIETGMFEWTVPGTSSGPSGSPIKLRCDLPSANIQGMTLPYSMSAEKGTEFKVDLVSQLDQGLTSALHDHREVYLIFRTATGRRAKGKIKYERS